MIEELVHASANLRLDGGGAAHLGRTIGRAIRRYASRRGLRFRGLHLPESDGHPALDGYVCCGGSQTRFALALASLQVGRSEKRALVFDHPGPARVQARLPRWARSPYLVFLLGVEVWHELAVDLRRALQGARRLVSISRTTLEMAKPFLPDAVHPVVVYPGLEGASTGGLVDAAKLARAGAGFVLTVARMSSSERYKGHDELLDAWPRLVARQADAKLVLVGEGDDRARLEQEARAAGLSDHVDFAGYVDPATLGELYRRAALVAMPSRGEGFGLTFLEAMANAKPGLALTGTAPAEILVDGESGRLVAPGDREALVEALAGMLADPRRSAEMGRAGRSRYEREFTFDAFEHRLEPVLDALLDGAAS